MSLWDIIWVPVEFAYSLFDSGYFYIIIIGLGIVLLLLIFR